MNTSKIKIVYDGLQEGNIFDFVKKFEKYKKEKIEEFIKDKKKVFLITKTVKFGEISDKSENFLKKYSDLVIGVAVSGNINYGKNFGKAGEKIQEKFNIPLILKFEGKGFNEDFIYLKKWLDNFSLEKKEEKILFNKIPPWITLNNEIIDEQGNIKDLKKDQEALTIFLEKEIKIKLKKFSTLKEKIDFLINNDYYEKDFLSLYNWEEIKTIYKIAYDKNFKFTSFIAAFKFFKDYALKTRDKKEYLESYEDRLVVNALYHASGDFETAKKMIHNLINQNFTPSTPTLLNSGLKKRGEFVSCFLLEAGDSLNDIARIIEFSMQLSKIGGGVSINLSNLRAKGESIKGINNSCKGVIGVAKLLDHSFRYADQMGQRLGAGAIYLNVFHADIEDFLNSKKLNSDEDIRLKTLSLGVVIPDKMLELARKNEKMALFYPNTVYQEYKLNFADLSIEMNKWYEILINNPKVKKRFINPRGLLELIAQLQGESGYPYLMFSDNVNKQNPLEDKIKFSNLCTEILQPSSASLYAPYHEREKDQIGMDISCNLSSGHMTNMIKNKAIKETVFSAMDIMNSVSLKTKIKHVPAIYKANFLNRSVGFGIMGHHGFIAENMIDFGSPEDLELINVFFNMVNYYSLLHSSLKAKETGEKFYQFEKSDYYNGKYFENKKAIYPTSEKVKKIFEGIEIPSDQDWLTLKENVISYGLYNSHRLAVAPNGSIGYIMSATPSLTPIKQLIEERTYGNSKTYFPAPSLKEYSFMYQTAYKMDKFKIIDVIATAQKHVDQGISFELCITSDVTTRGLQKYYLYAHHKGIKTLYYTRTQKLKIFECESCGV
ncbi:MAG: class 1b ribonucleoside-diphosphate reductase subunit alpha [Candidatus Phytoplasma stylosanthis]|uniref:class 1b ribonucleoside-diphosphate reductase subunit alpha n=1 Tax=Candidatus Phytoplasma stylosanthis TaxID=2798314 RepID=UPI0029396E30|nr:class 1b ribonucleoside-diphosphate reductase subunit alpha [Candidatus Phytoplasma stylosanthis]MDV3167982.1 class 1b ribonucleoside-diphosphate reductase subunit alpha [Candidatus Phytoplasma stylosanthis]MDV3170783.1 class 1b ribonucleoside-diphosphate reductase subunit alpha [Candidatus Phytoplasma stylosanthis]MDV3173543.1 class 1b ribonucleoside-diphosphate reductase subunit alpha [Candidatus Phytoplasma stylosanthis]MDV3174295.1 class 1b ribonucleoside-diphosphate reductase subunit al